MNFFRIFVKFGQSALQTIIGILMLIFYFSYIIAAIWLLILGDWKPLLQGIIISLISFWGASIFLLPTLGLGALVAFFANRKNELAVQFFSLIAILFQNALLIVWAVFIFYTFSSSWGTSKNLIPLLILSYNVVMGVLVFMARGESPDSLGTNLGLMLGFISSLAMIFMFLFTGFSFVPLIVIFALFSIFQFVMVIYMQQEAENQN
jgi:hypothetical protein